MITPDRNLPPDAQAWGRAIEKRLDELTKRVGITQTNLKAARSQYVGLHRFSESLEQVIADQADQVQDTAQEVGSRPTNEWAGKEPANPKHGDVWYDAADGNVQKVRVDLGDEPRTNYVTNPSFRFSTQGWVATDATLTRGEEGTGRVVLTDQVQGTLWESAGREYYETIPASPADEEGEGGSPEMTVPVQWTASALVRMEGDAAEGFVELVVSYGTDPNGTVIATSERIPFDAGNPVRLQTKPVDGIELTAGPVYVGFIFRSAQGFEDDEYIFHVDEVILEPLNYGDVVQGYFDGDTPGAEWSGLTHRSTSLWDGVPRWELAQDNKMREEFYENIETLEDELAVAEQLIEDVSQLLADETFELNQRLNAADQAISDAEGRLDTAESNLSSAMQAIDDAATWIDQTGSGLATRLDTAEGDLADARTRLDTAESNLSSAMQAIDDAATWIDQTGSGLATRLDTAEGDLADAQTAINDLGEDVAIAATTAAVENLYVTGNATVNEAVANKVWAAKIAAQKVMANEVVIGGATNMWPDPFFQEDIYGSWTRVDGGIERDGTGDGIGVQYLSNPVAFMPVKPGDIIKITADLTMDGPGMGEIWWRQADMNRSYIGGTAAGHALSESGTLTIEREVTADNAAFIYIGFGDRDTPSTTRLRWTNLRVERLVDHSLIVDGAIAARHVDAESVAGAVGEFVEVDVENLRVSGTSTVNEQVAESIWAAKVAARKVMAHEVVIGPGANLIPDPAFADEQIRALRAALSSSSFFSDTRGTWAFRFYGSPDDAENRYAWVAGSRWIDDGMRVAVTPGTRYRLSGRVYLTGGEGSWGNVRWIVYYFDRDGNVTTDWQVAQALDPGDNIVEYETVAPVDAERAAVAFVAQDSLGNIYLTEPSMLSMVDHSLVVDGAIAARHVDAESVAGAVGQFIDLDVAQLSVTNVANLKQAVADAFWAKKIAAQKILANEVLIGGASNIIPDPFFQDAPTTAARLSRSTGTWTSGTASEDGVTYFRNDVPTGGTRSFYLATIGRTNAQARESYPEVRPGEQYRIRVDVQGDGGVRFAGEVIYADGSHGFPAIGFYQSGNGRWTREEIYTIPDNAVAFMPLVQFNANNTGSVYVYGGIKVERMIDANLIVDGAVTARKITASEELWAKVIGTHKITAEEADLGSFVADDGFVMDLTARVVTSDMFVGKTFTGGTFTGTTFRTSASGRRIQMDSVGLRGFNPNGTEYASLTEAAGGTLTLTIQSGYEPDETIGNWLPPGTLKFAHVPGATTAGIGWTSGRMFRMVYLRNSRTNTDHASGVFLGDRTAQITAGYSGTGGADSGLYLDSANLPGVTLRSAGGASIFMNQSIELAGDVSISGKIHATGNAQDLVTAGGGNSRVVFGVGANGYPAIFLTTWGHLSNWPAALYTESDGKLNLRGAPNTGVRIVSGQYFDYYDPPTSTFAANVGIASNPKDRIYKLTSARKHKVNIEAVDPAKPARILDLEPRLWLDRSQVEGQVGADAVEDTPDGPRLTDRHVLGGMRRVPGLVAEEVREAGLDEYVTYGADGELEGLSYDRLWTLLIPLVRDQRNQIVELTARVEALECR